MTRVKGFNGIDRALQRLDTQMRAETLVRVLKESAEPFEAEYERGAPPFLHGKVRTRVADVGRTGATVATGSKHPLAHIFEFGTRVRKTSSGWLRGSIRNMGFGRRAFDTRVQSWFGDVGKLLWREVKRVRR